MLKILSPSRGSLLPSGLLWLDRASKLTACATKQRKSQRGMPAGAGCGHSYLPKNPLKFSSNSCYKAPSSSSKTFSGAASKSHSAPNSCLLICMLCGSSPYCIYPGLGTASIHGEAQAKYAVIASNKHLDCHFRGVQPPLLKLVLGL